MSASPDLPILVVDDYTTVVRIVSSLLKQAGYEDVDGATNGEEALSKMKDRKYGLVISDWHMEPTSGMDLLRKIRSDDDLRDVPFIMISAEISPENVAMAREEGASAYVAKPFDAAILRERVQKAVHA